MARAILALVAALAAGCALPPQGGDQTQCIPLFEQYDVYAQFNPNSVDAGWGAGFTLEPPTSYFARLLIVNDCITRDADLGGLDAVAAARAPITESGAPLGRPVAVHVGAFAGDASAARAVALFTRLGLRATSIGNPQLGRRVYAGPVRTEGALAEVLAVARAAGMIAPYPSRFFRF